MADPVSAGVPQPANASPNADQTAGNVANPTALTSQLGRRPLAGFEGTSYASPTDAGILNYPNLGLGPVGQPAQALDSNNTITTSVPAFSSDPDDNSLAIGDLVIVYHDDRNNASVGLSIALINYMLANTGMLKDRDIHELDLMVKPYGFLSNITDAGQRRRYHTALPSRHFRQRKLAGVLNVQTGGFAYSACNLFGAQNDDDRLYLKAVKRKLGRLQQRKYTSAAGTALYLGGGADMTPQTLVWQLEPHIINDTLSMPTIGDCWGDETPEDLGPNGLPTRANPAAPSGGFWYLGRAKHVKATPSKDHIQKALVSVKDAHAIPRMTATVNIGPPRGFQ